MATFARTAGLAVALLLAAAAPAAACSTDDTSWFETFIDTSCLLQPTTNTELDGLGGLRLSTAGTPVDEVWDTQNDFAQSAAEAEAVGENTLAVEGSGTAAKLVLPVNDLPLTRSGPVFGPEAATVDGDAVDDPAVVKVGSTYVMYYTGYAEDGDPSAIYRATSGDGRTWAKDTGGGDDPVAMLSGGPGTWDEHGVYAPDVTYDAADPVAPYRMYYTGRGDVFDQIGLATSQDGRVWTKHAENPVLRVGRPGSGDTFKVADPSVLKDGDTWRMWYTGDDSNKLRISYATSSDGLVWQKGGKVIAPEDDDATGNTEFGVWAPTVWFDGAKYQMRLAGRKEVGGNDFQPKIMQAESPDGLDWSSPSPAINESGGSFYADDLDSPEALVDGGGVKLYFTGVAEATTELPVRRIGLDGHTSTTPGALGAVLTPTPPTADDPFDARRTSGVAAARSTGDFVGAYSGVRNFDMVERLGLATSDDMAEWTRVGTSGDGFLPTTSIDQSGQREPWMLLDGSTWHVYYTALGANGIGVAHASAPDVAGVPGTWTKDATLRVPSASNPSVIKDGSTYVMYTTTTAGTNIARYTSATADFATPSAAQTVLFNAPGESIGNPAVVKLGAGSYVMAYTSEESIPGRPPVRRIHLATSTDGIVWEKQGLWLAPSQVPYAYDETGVEPAGLRVDGTALELSVEGYGHDDRTRGGNASATTGAADAEIPNAWSTYQFGDAATDIRDFRRITRTSSATGVELWMSILQPYSSGGSEYWSDFFPVTEDATTEELAFLLNVRGVRWQARLREPAAELGKVELEHAPVVFAASGSAQTTEIAPPEGQAATSWTELTVGATTFGGAGATSGTVRILDAASGAELASMPVPADGEETIALSGISTAEHPKLRARIELASADGTATPLVSLVKVRYNAVPIEEPPPPPAPVLTFASALPVVTFGKPVTLSGTVTQAGVGVAGAAVSIAQQPIGTTAFAPLATATTVAPAGTFTQTATPRKHTTYQATLAGATGSPATVTVQVRHRVTLKARRSGNRVTLSGKIGPRHKKRRVVLQRKAGKKWVTFARTRTNKKSAFRVVKSVTAGKAYVFRARTKADAQHLAGKSRRRRVGKG